MLLLSTTYQDQTVIRLTDVIPPHYYETYWDVVDGKHTYYDLFGGRGSLKSSVASAIIVLGIMDDPEANAIVFRKVAGTLSESVYEQIQWTINKLNVQQYWKCTTSPLRCVYKPTGQRISFRGLDDATKIKSIKVSKGYWKYLWFEELDEFSGEEEIRKVQQSILRGEDDGDWKEEDLWNDDELEQINGKFVVLKTFNPPISNANWVNKYVQVPRKDAYRHKSTYLDAPRKWLGKQFYRDALHLKKVNEKAYTHEYLGEPVGTGTNIFEFLEIRTITDEEIAQMDRIYQGQDWGWYPDPAAFIRNYYNHNQEKIYLIDELGGCKLRNSILAQQIIEKGYDDYEIICDSAENKSITDYRDMGLPARAAIKGPGSVEYGMKWLQGKIIVIDPIRTPNAYKEIIEYEHDVDKNGNVIGGYPDRDNHWIDALRYSLEPVIGRRGNKA